MVQGSQGGEGRLHLAPDFCDRYCGRLKKWPLEDVHILTPDPMNMLPYVNRILQM